MKEGQKLWTKDELTLAINLYCKLPFGKMHSRNEEIKKLAEIIGRTPSSIALKLGIFASFDPTLKEEKIKSLQSFLPNINEKQMYLTFMVPFFRAEDKEGTTPSTAGGLSNDTRATTNRADFPMTIIGVGLLEDKKKQKGVHIILPEAGHISTSMALLYKPNKFEFGLFSKEMQENLEKALNSILEDNDLIID